MLLYKLMTESHMNIEAVSDHLAIVGCRNTS